MIHVFEVATNEFIIRGDLKSDIWITAAISLSMAIPLGFIGEYYKHRELKLYRRNQRRRKLNFNTKLGMNSPY
jgi:hypothetical protein